MKKNTRSLLLFGLTSALLLTGGCSKSEVIEIDGKQYWKNDTGYTQIMGETKTFLPGEHTIYYNVDVSRERYAYHDNGWGNALLYIPEAPEGYKYVNTVTIDDGGYGYTSNLVHVFVNEVNVEATSSYNKETEEFGFFEPGKPVKQLKLD